MEEIPATTDLAELADAAARCTRCPLYEPATQVVFGEGRRGARLMLVGEQPGDAEDTQGVPFVGPAGRVLDQALEEAGIDREDAYVTNLVKHFKFTRKGKRRIHQTPEADEIFACRPWLEAELAAVDPKVVVALGATAAKSLYGSGYRVTRQRGDVQERDGRRWTATVHPSSILRVPSEYREEQRQGLVADLEGIAALLDA